MWEDLNLKQKAAIVAEANQQGITNINNIARLYNKQVKNNIFSGGGEMGSQQNAQQSFGHIDPSLSIYDALRMAGVRFATSNPSGYRTKSQQKRFTSGEKSWHRHLREDGKTAWALDIVPDFSRGADWDTLAYELTQNGLPEYFAANGLGVLNETDPKIKKKTNATGSHYHIGRDSNPLLKQTYGEWVAKYSKKEKTISIPGYTDDGLTLQDRIRGLERDINPANNSATSELEDTNYEVPQFFNPASSVISSDTPQSIRESINYDSGLSEYAKNIEENRKDFLKQLLLSTFEEEDDSIPQFTLGYPNINSWGGPLTLQALPSVKLLKHSGRTNTKPPKRTIKFKNGVTLTYDGHRWLRNGKEVDYGKYKFINEADGRAMKVEPGRSVPIIDTPYLNRLRNNRRARKLNKDQFKYIEKEGKTIQLRTKGDMNLAKIPYNLLDSIAKSAGRAHGDVKTLLGIAGKESTFQGSLEFNPLWFTKYRLVNNHAWRQSPEKDYYGAVTRRYFRNLGVLSDEDYAKRIKEAEEDVKYAYTYGNLKKGIGATPIFDKDDVLADALMRYTSNPSGYNPRQKNYPAMVSNIASEVWGEPQIQEWWNTSGKKQYALGKSERKRALGGNLFYQGGEKYNDDFMRQYNLDWTPFSQLYSGDPYYSKIREHELATSNGKEGTYATNAEGRYVPASEMRKLWDDYLLTQAQVNNKEGLEVAKAQQYRQNQEFNRQVDNFFTGNWLMPSQIAGAAVRRESDSNFFRTLLDYNNGLVQAILNNDRDLYNKYHNSDPSEKYADLMALRYYLYATGVYDSRDSEKLDPNDSKLQKAIRDFSRYLGGTLFESEGNSIEDVVKALNEVAYNPTVSGLQSNNYAALGGNLFQGGGYQDWKKRMESYKGIPMNDLGDYLYNDFYFSNPPKAWAMLGQDPRAHFTDEFKTVYHPTFSIDSKASGKYDPRYNPFGYTGGRWEGNTFYAPQFSPVSMDERMGYLVNAEEQGARLKDYNGEPVWLGDGSIFGPILPNITVTPNAKKKKK